MTSNHIPYDFAKSKIRINDILNTSDVSYEELKYIPSRDKLTFNNGFYVDCTILFVDIRKSAELPTKYNRPTLARIYRSFISEVIAVINGNTCCSEITIEGDCVWGVFNTPKKFEVDSVFATSAEISSLIDALNIKLNAKGIESLVVGIAMDYGRALMIKAGYNGSGINDIVWMGEVVSSTAKLASMGNKEFNPELLVSSVIYNNLNDHNKSLLRWLYNQNCYGGNVINAEMNNDLT